MECELDLFPVHKPWSTIKRQEKLLKVATRAGSWHLRATCGIAGYQAPAVQQGVGGKTLELQVLIRSYWP